VGLHLKNAEIGSGRTNHKPAMLDRPFQPPFCRQLEVHLLAVGKMHHNQFGSARSERNLTQVSGIVAKELIHLAFPFRSQIRS